MGYRRRYTIDRRETVIGSIREQKTEIISTKRY
jgi:hypothetical protein